jgi:hypothetical protein
MKFGTHTEKKLLSNLEKQQILPVENGKALQP